MRPLVKRYPLAVDRARYAGEWVAAVVADSRALAEDAREKIRVDYEPLPFLLDGEAAYEAGSTPVHPDHGSNVLLDKRFVWGDVDAAFAAAPHKLAYRVKWGRSATVPIETFGVVASWDPWREMLDVWASIQMPKYADQIARALRMPLNGVRVHQDVDVGGSYGVKRGIKHTVLAGYLSRRLSRPVKLIEDRLENMRGGDMHGPERVFDVELAFDGAGWSTPCACARSTTSAPTRAARRCSLASPSAPSSAPTASARSPIMPSPSPPTRRRRRRCAASASRPPTTPSRPASTASPRRWGWTGWRCGGAISSAPRSSRI